MEFTEFMTPECVIASLRATSKKQALQELAKKAAEISGADERQILEVVMERERLGTTGVGNGIAIPHGKLPGLKRMSGVFARLEKGLRKHYRLTEDGLRSVSVHASDVEEEHGSLGPIAMRRYATTKQAQDGVRFAVTHTADVYYNQYNVWNYY